MAPGSLDRIFESAARPASSKQSRAGPPTDEDVVVKELPGGYKKLASGVVLDKDGKP